MDFHGLVRKELQALCKLNKIPANLTNVAMADALSSLDHVEGLGEIMEQRNKGSVGGGSPEVPRTATRTSTRGRKPPVNVLESGGVIPSSRARGRTSRKVGDGDSAEDGMKGAEKTPVVASCRKRGGCAGVASSRRKVEVPSVQRVYSTRRSVRLVEKQMSELCLADSVRRTRQPITIDDELSSDVNFSNIKGGQPVDVVDVAVQGSEALNGGLACVASIDDVAKALPDESAIDVVSALDNVAPEIVVETNVQGSELPTTDGKIDNSDDCEKEVVGEIDNAETEAEIVEVIDAPDDKIPNVAAVTDNVDDEVKESGVTALVAIEVVKSSSDDFPDALDTINCDADGHESTGRKDAVATEEVDEVMPGSDALDAESVTPVTNVEQGLAVWEVSQANAVADHMPYLLIRKDTEFELTADHDIERDGVCGYDQVPKLEASFKSADNAKAAKEVARTETDTVNHDEDVTAFADFEVTSCLKNASVKKIPASQTPQPVSTKATTPVRGSNSNFKGEKSMTKNVIKQMPIATEGMNKENISSIIKSEESRETSTKFNNMSIRKLLKTFKRLTINNNENVESVNADIHQGKLQHQQAVTPRKALQAIPDNTHKQ